MTFLAVFDKFSIVFGIFHKNFINIKQAWAKLAVWEKFAVGLEG
jgi:hypothetical protein